MPLVMPQMIPVPLCINETWVSWVKVTQQVTYTCRLLTVSSFITNVSRVEGMIKTKVTKNVIV